MLTKLTESASNSSVPLLWLLAATASLLGCGSDNAYDTVKVSGTVKYDDGTLIPAARIELRFVPQAAAIDAKTTPKFGVAEVNMEDGTFSNVSTYDFGDGIIAGEHKVAALAMAYPAGYTDNIPEEYRSSNTTPLVVNTSDRPFEIIIPKPAKVEPFRTDG